MHVNRQEVVIEGEGHLTKNCAVLLIYTRWNTEVSLVAEQDKHVMREVRIKFVLVS